MRKAMIALLGLCVAGITQPAHALLQLSAQIGGTTFFCADQNFACDTNPLVGTLQIANQTLSGVQINGSIQTSTKGTVNQIDTSSLSIINTNPTATGVTLTVGDTGFIGPVDTYTASGSGTFQGPTGNQLTMNWFNDPNNQQGADLPNDTPGNKIDTFTVTQSLQRSQSFSYNNTGPAIDPDLFSMTIQTIGTLLPGGQLLSRGQTEIKELIAVSEPGSLALLGSMLLGASFLLRRRQQ